MIIAFTHTHDEIEKAVKRETSLLAVRQRDQEGNSLLDEYVFDEANDIAFRDYFKDAQANITMACAAYIRDIEGASEEVNGDFILYLNIDLISSLQNSVDTMMKNYIVNYIMYLWFKTKLPQEAQLFYQNAEKYLTDMKRLLEMRGSRAIKATRLY